MFSVLAKSGEVLFQGGRDDSHDASPAPRMTISRPRFKTCTRDMRRKSTSPAASGVLSGDDFNEDKSLFP